MTESTALPNWPYPRWIAHRGAGTLAPENTLAAFRLGASHGYRMFECDVKLSRDGVPFLLHDDTLTRTAHALTPPPSPNPQASAVAGDYPWHTLAQYDAGGWHSSAYAGEPLPTLAQIARFCIRNGYFLNIEIKPTTGTERQTGEVVAQHATRLWQGVAVPPLLTCSNVANFGCELR
jgi:glycerophosphoryl diester phosphodiesterase